MSAPGCVVDEPGAMAWLIAVLVVAAVRAVVAMVKRRRSARVTWCGRWFEASTSWPPRRGAGTEQVPTQSDIGQGGSR